MADALAVATAYLNRRERTVAEVRSRLEKTECPSEEAEAAITELLATGFLDDDRYARIFIEDKRTLDSWGIERIERALSERGIERHVVTAALSETGEAEGSELDRALELLQRRFSLLTDDPRERERAFGMLVRKGYGTELAGDAVRAWIRRESLPH